MNIVINILMAIFSSETIKVIARKATRKLVEKTGTSIDPELTKALLTDIAASKGNNVTAVVIDKIIKGL